MDELNIKLGQNINTLNAYLDASGLSRPSFNRDTPRVILPQDAPPEVQDARQQIMDASLRLFRLAAGPSDYISNFRTGFNETAVVQWLVRFQIFDIVPTEKSISYTELADKANVAVVHAKSIIRMAMSSGLFEEPEPQQVGHSAISLYIRNNQHERTRASWFCDVSVPAAAAMVSAHAKWPRSLSRTHTAHNVANDTDLPFFEHLGQHPERKVHFESLMKAAGSAQHLSVEHTIAGFDWAGLGEATVVDIGGSKGHVSIALARKFPSLGFIVQDLPDVVSNAKPGLLSLSDGAALESRIKYLAHNFFDPQPVQGAAVYFLRMILHDWPTEDAVRILSQLVPALGKDSRIIVIDSVMPDPGAVPLQRERMLRAQDLTMLHSFNGQERAVEDWKGIFHQVDERLQLSAIKQPVGSDMACMELVLTESEIRDGFE